MRKLELDKACVWFSQHHLSHAYASISSGDGRDGLVLVLDAIGEKSSGLIGKYINNQLTQYEFLPIKKVLD